MCVTCGCSDEATPSIHDLSDDSHHHIHDHDHSHDHGHDHGHGHDHVHTRREAEEILLEQRVLAKNDHLAERNRGWFDAREVLALNLMSSPGAGKTTLLVRTLKELGGEVSVIEGDQETALDAERIRETGAKVIQVNTGKGCHLEADMVWAGLQRLRPAIGSVLFIENVGNLVCPAMFDLGEQARVVLFSTTEGEDKPTKYPHMFQTADLVLLTKVDLLPYLDFDLDRALDAVRAVNPDAQLMQVSSRSGEGMDDWYRWIREHTIALSHE
ncbi:MAG: hydrogenase nickel incorporation protein HypB [Myxococcota bacterium]